jgi:hypothetical protein
VPQLGQKAQVTEPPLSAALWKVFGDPLSIDMEFLGMSRLIPKALPDWR